jgi:hypothetical protein
MPACLDGRMHRVRSGVGCGTGPGLSLHTFELVSTMPSPRKLRRKVLTVSASDSGRFTDEGFGTKLDESVTRNVTVTFKKL